MDRSGSEVADSEDTGAINSAEREKSMNTEEHSSAGCQHQALMWKAARLFWFVPKDSYLLFKLQQSSKKGNITSYHQ